MTGTFSDIFSQPVPANEGETPTNPTDHPQPEMPGKDPGYVDPPKPGHELVAASDSDDLGGSDGMADG
ncbi:MAG TPA: hypothetical protein VMG08_19455 [Allosphingosinicella sp.]|nr:hypothetical protein [Allosphingosinicella sp.]